MRGWGLGWGGLEGSRARNYRGQVEDKRLLGGRSLKRRRIVEADHNQKVGSREAEGVLQGAGESRRGHSKSASTLSRLLKGFGDGNTQYKQHRAYNITGPD